MGFESQAPARGPRASPPRSGQKNAAARRGRAGCATDAGVERIPAREGRAPPEARRGAAIPDPLLLPVRPPGIPSPVPVPEAIDRRSKNQSRAGRSGGPWTGAAGRRVVAAAAFVRKVPELACGAGAWGRRRLDARSSRAGTKRGAFLPSPRSAGLARGGARRCCCQLLCFCAPAAVLRLLCSCFCGDRERQEHLHTPFRSSSARDNPRMPPGLENGRRRRRLCRRNEPFRLPARCVRLL
jgi:hypothetical protein